MAAGRARRGARGRRAGDPGGRGGPADARPAGPRPRLAGSIAASRGADDLPVRGDAGRRRAVRAAVGPSRGARRGRRRPHPRVWLRGGLPRVHRTTARARRRRQAARPAPPRRARAKAGPAATGRARPRGGRVTTEATGISRERRLANLRATLARAGGGPAGADPIPARAPFAGRRSPQLAARLASSLGADVADTPDGWLVRRVLAPIDIPVDRHRLARLPGHPPAAAPLVCIDTETTGLAT